MYLIVSEVYGVRTNAPMHAITIAAHNVWFVYRCYTYIVFLRHTCTGPYNCISVHVCTCARVQVFVGFSQLQFHLNSYPHLHSPADVFFLNAHYMFALTTHCAETGEGFGPVPASIGIT